MDLLDELQGFDLNYEEDFPVIPNYVEETSSSDILDVLQSGPMKVESEESPPAAEEPSKKSSPILQLLSKRGRPKKKVSDDNFEPTHSSEGMSEAKPKQSGSGKSKKRTNEVMNDFGDSITLSRETLLTISSEEFEQFLERLTVGRNLTDFEVKEVRRQRRLIKNRESAALSRNRKKQVMETLETENARLKEEMEAQKQKWSLLETILKQTGQFKDVMEQLNVGKPRASTGVMFAVLFSFALLWVLPAFTADLSTGLPAASSCGSRCGKSASIDVSNLRKLMSVEFGSNVSEVYCDGVDSEDLSVNATLTSCVNSPLINV